MGWRGVLRSVHALPKKERPAYRRYLALEKRLPQLSTLPADERAALEVAIYQNRLDLLRTVHDECSPAIDWDAVRKSAAPVKPKLEHRREALARYAFQSYKPTLLEKMRGQAQAKVVALAEAARQAKEADLEEFREASERYRKEHAEWEATRGLADKVLAGDRTAYETVVQDATPFLDFSTFGSETFLRFRRETAIVELWVHGKTAVPAETKALGEDGSVATALMPKDQWLTLYRDFVCGSALRLGRELFALLPLAKVIVDVMGDVLIAETGYIEPRTILSVGFSRRSFEAIEWETAQPSIVVARFMHRMSFDTATGFKAVEPLTGGAR